MRRGADDRQPGWIHVVPRALASPGRWPALAAFVVLLACACGPAPVTSGQAANPPLPSAGSHRQAYASGPDGSTSDSGAHADVAPTDPPVPLPAEIRLLHGAVGKGVGGPWTAATIDYSATGVMLHIDYPQVARSGIAALAINQSIRSTMTKYENDWLTTVAGPNRSSNNSISNECAAYQTFADARFGGMLVVCVWFAQGTPHPSTDRFTFNADLSSGRLLSTADLFADSAYFAALTAAVDTDTQQRYGVGFANRIQSSPSLLDRIVLAPRGLLVEFGDGSGLSHAIANIEAFVPTNTIAASLRPDLVAALNSSDP